jgi:hypothetical protein
MGNKMLKQNKPFTRFTFTKMIIIAEEVLSIKARDFLSIFNVPQDLDAGGVPARGNKLPTHTPNM